MLYRAVANDPFHELQLWFQWKSILCPRHNQIDREEWICCFFQIEGAGFDDTLFMVESQEES